MRSLGKLTRGLSSLFWGLPAWLVICADTAREDGLGMGGIIPALAVNVLLMYGLMQISSFQANERPWKQALDRARFFGWINLGYCPFPFWFSRMPDQPFFRDSMMVMTCSALMFLFCLNGVLKQLGLMLPDETLRQEMRQFTTLNRWLLFLWALAMAAVFGLPAMAGLQLHLSAPAMAWFWNLTTTLLLCLGLSPLAITMALVWKTKETVFHSILGC